MLNSRDGVQDENYTKFGLYTVQSSALSKHTLCFTYFAQFLNECSSKATVVDKRDQIWHFYRCKNQGMMWQNVRVMVSSSTHYTSSDVNGVTRVGDTRATTEGVTPCLKSWRPLFCSSLVTSYWFHSGVTSWRVLPRTFFYLSDLISPLFFINLPTKFFPSGVTLLEGVTRSGQPPLPP